MTTDLYFVKRKSFEHERDGRATDGSLLLHSPIALGSPHQEQLEALGPIDRRHDRAERAASAGRARVQGALSKARHVRAELAEAARRLPRFGPTVTGVYIGEMERLREELAP